MEWMILPLRRYFRFLGRSRRKEFWMFFLFTIIVGVVASLIDGLLGFGDLYSVTSSDAIAAGATSNGPVNAIASLLLLIPTFSVAFRRLHDTDRSAWWLLLILVPVLGWIVLLVFYCLDGTPGPNRYGPDPKNPDGDLVEVFG